MNDITLVSHISSLAGPKANSAEKLAGGFADTLKEMVAETNKQQIQSDQAVQQLHTGEAKNLHEVMLSLEKADISVRLLVQFRNKIMNAYNEIMKLQV